MQWVGLKYTLMEGTDREVHEVPKLIEIMEKFEIKFFDEISNILINIQPRQNTDIYIKHNFNSICFRN